MQSQRAIRDALQAVTKDLEHLEEMRAMRTLNQGYSEIRNSAINEIERLMLERRKTLLWVLKEEDVDTTS